MSPNPAPFQRLFTGKLGDVVAEQSRRSHELAILELQRRLAAALIEIGAIDTSGSSGVPDGDKGDITVTASGATWTIDAGVVTLAKMANLAAARIIGSVAGGTPAALTGTQVTALLDLVTAAARGLVPPPGSPTGRFFDDALGWSDTVRSSPGWFGTGADGDVTLGAGTTTLTRVMFYNNLTIPSGSTLRPANFPFYVAGTLTIAAGGAISSGGNPGSASSGGNSGAGTTGPGGAGGGNGANGGTTNGSNASNLAAGSQPPPYTTALGAGGAGGASASGTGGTGGLGGTNWTGAAGGLWQMPYLVTGRPSHSATSVICGGAGGGGGAGSGVAAGGGGGGGGQPVLFAARYISHAGTIDSDGGAGAAGPGTNRSGGGGGGGGKVFYAYERLSGAGTITANGGAAGASGGGTGTPGAAGSAGLVVGIQV